MARIELTAEMDDGATHSVLVDQRDYAKWEVQEDVGHVTRLRFLAWSAMTRQGLTKVPFVQFNEKDCVEVRSADDGESEDEQGLDPGKPEATAAR